MAKQTIKPGKNYKYAGSDFKGVQSIKVLHRANSEAHRCEATIKPTKGEEYTKMLLIYDWEFGPEIL